MNTPEAAANDNRSNPFEVYHEDPVAGESLHEAHLRVGNLQKAMRVAAFPSLGGIGFLLYLAQQ